jgi:hypothetical protein
MTAASEAITPGASSNDVVVALPAATTDPAGSDADSGRQEPQRIVEEEDEDDLEFALGGFGEDDYPEGAVGTDAETGRQESIDNKTESGPGTDSGSNSGRAAIETETTTPQEQPVRDDVDRVAQKAKAGEEGKAALMKSRFAVKEE